MKFALQNSAAPQTVTLSPEITLQVLATRGLAIHNGELVIMAGPSHSSSSDSGIGDGFDDPVANRDADNNITDTDQMDVHDFIDGKSGMTEKPIRYPDESPSERFFTELLNQIDEREGHVNELMELYALLEAESAKLHARERGLVATNRGLQKAIEYRVETFLVQDTIAGPEVSAAKTEELHKVLRNQTETIDQQKRHIDILQLETRVLEFEADQLQLQLERIAQTPLPTCVCGGIQWYPTTPNVHSGLSNERMVWPTLEYVVDASQLDSHHATKIREEDRSRRLSSTQDRPCPVHAVALHPKVQELAEDEFVANVVLLFVNWMDIL
ncbi:hypothetical protein CspHIS471_0502460 [Cutaneotrichosporon sp. HIS471]|nr:hypothetical protein CspHIS471_0502460 [Cutaneotrichosporon sp. HIS471]